MLDTYPRSSPQNHGKPNIIYDVHAKTTISTVAGKKVSLNTKPPNILKACASRLNPALIRITARANDLKGRKNIKPY